MKRYLSPSRKLVLLLMGIIMVLGACAGMQVKDPVKASLYTVKEEFMAIREYVVKQNLAGKLSDAEWQEYKKLDNRFTALYGSTLLIYKVGTDNGALVSGNVNKLRDLLLDARQKFYPGQ